jgi:O-antigen/teichoic acid export membrane protein
MIRRALQNTGWPMGARGINAVLSLAYLALATRALRLKDFGTFSLAVTFAQAITGLASFQTWQAVVRWGRRKETAEDAAGFTIALDLLSIAGGAATAGRCCGWRVAGCRSRASFGCRLRLHPRAAAGDPLHANRNSAAA